MQEVICISTCDFKRGLEVGKTYFIDTSSIHGDSEGNWYAEVSKDKTMTVYIGRMNLKHFKSAV